MFQVGLHELDDTDQLLHELVDKLQLLSLSLNWEDLTVLNRSGMRE